MLELTLEGCQKCKLCSTRKHIVVGEGNLTADLMFVGEAPGANEDEEGRPFIGKAGDLLDKIIAAMGFDRWDVYITNVIKCRPPENRDPEPDEIEACNSYLDQQITLIKPKIIVALGKFASQYLTQSDEPISKMRGNFAKCDDIYLMPTFHPAYLLRNAAAKKDVWEDMQQVMRKLKHG